MFRLAPLFLVFFACSSSGYNAQFCLDVEGSERCWDQHVPTSTITNPALVIDLHGWSSDPADQRQLSGWQTLADEEGFVVAWPLGQDFSFNAGPSCCKPASADGVDDVGFLRALIKQMIAKHRIDQKRVYLTGLSNGCAMAQRFASDASDAVAAVACMSQFLLVERTSSYEPVAVLEVHGLADKIVSFESGRFPGAMANLERWKTMNNCTGQAVETWREKESFALTYLDCDGDTEISLLQVQDAGHHPYPGADTSIDTTRMAWTFLKRFTR